MAKPTVYPDFAMDDVVDATSGQNNVLEPSSGKKSTGWNRHETPPRQWMNWLHRTNSLWVRWLEEITDSNELRIEDVEDVILAATNIATPSTLVMRDASGRFRASDPSDSSDVVNRGWLLNNIFESGVRCVFYQAAAPNGWTLVSGVNDRGLIAVSSGGGSTGGSWTISGLTVGGTALTTAQLPSHNHNSGSIHRSGITASYGSSAASGNTGDVSDIQTITGKRVTTSSTGSGSTHTHSISSAGTWRYAYATVIICSRNSPA